MARQLRRVSNARARARPSILRPNSAPPGQASAEFGLAAEVARFRRRQAAEWSELLALAVGRKVNLLRQMSSGQPGLPAAGAIVRPSPVARQTNDWRPQTGNRRAGGRAKKAPPTCGRRKWAGCSAHGGSSRRPYRPAASSGGPQKPGCPLGQRL